MVGGREGGREKRRETRREVEGGERGDSTRFNARTHRVDPTRHRLNPGSPVIVAIGVNSNPLFVVDNM